MRALTRMERPPTDRDAAGRGRWRCRLSRLSGRTEPFGCGICNSEFLGELVKCAAGAEFELFAHLLLGDRESAFDKFATDPGDDRIVCRTGESGVDDLHHVTGRRFTPSAHMGRGPQAKELVAPQHDAEREIEIP